MLRSWINGMGRLRLVALATIAVMTGGVLIEAAEARVGRSRGGSYRSFGNRGTRTFDRGGPGSQMQPIQGSPQSRANRATNPQANRGSWLQRNPLMAGIMGALAGTVLGAMLMNMFGGMGGFGSILMMLLFGLVLMMVVGAAMRMFKGRQQPATVGNARNDNFGGGNFGGGNLGGLNGPSNNGSYGGLGNGGYNDAPMNTQSREQGLAAIALEDSTMTQEKLQDTLSNRFFQIQEAWSAGDRASLNVASTPEMYGELVSDL